MTRQILKRPFRVLGQVFLALAALLVLLGAWTFTFTESDGQLLSLADTGMMMSGSYSGIPFVHNRPSHSTSLAVEYRYRVDGRRLEGTRIGMGLAPWTLSPFGPMRWERQLERQDGLTVYHARGMPEVSVLHRGFDVVSVLVLLLVGVVLLKFSAWLERHMAHEPSER